MKIELIQRENTKGYILEWVNHYEDHMRVFKTNENNPVGIFLMVPEACNIMYQGLDNSGKYCSFVEKNFGPVSMLSQIDSINIMRSVSHRLGDDFVADGDDIVALEATPRGTREFQEILAKVYKNAVCIYLKFENNKLIDVIYEFNVDWKDYRNSPFKKISIMHQMAPGSITNDPLIINGIEGNKIYLTFNEGNSLYNAYWFEGKILDEQVPNGAFKYEVRGRDDDPGAYYSLEEHVSVNFVATILTFRPVREAFLASIGRPDIKIYAVIEDAVDFDANWTVATAGCVSRDVIDRMIEKHEQS